MIIIETCPECGHDLIDEVICTAPPIPRKVCHNCGWNWEGHLEEVVRVPFSGNSYRDKSTLTTTSTDRISININDYPPIDNFSQPACINCSSNPNNGGDGICFCTLGQMIIY